MDPRLLSYYERELQHIREMGAEFAQEFPKIAGRLGLEGFECADPYVERLLEGFAFLAARVQLKLDAEFPQEPHDAPKLDSGLASFHFAHEHVTNARASRNIIHPEPLDFAGGPNEQTQLMG